MCDLCGEIKVPQYSKDNFKDSENGFYHPTFIWILGTQLRLWGLSSQSSSSSGPQVAFIRHLLAAVSKVTIIVVIETEALQRQSGLKRSWELL